jgi:carboxypeptidase family protein/TonB-dependent receptor-like protein
MTFLRKSVFIFARMAMVAAVLVATPFLHAQLSTGSVSGQIKDSSGAAIPGATITITNRGTGLVRTAQTSPDGRYKIAALASGNYDVKAEAPAFRPELQQNLTVTVAQETVLNFMLQVGAVTETVTVAAEAPLVETTSGALGGLVNEEKVSDLPLNGRNFNDLVLLQTGINVHHVGAGTNSTSTIAIGLAYSSNGAPIRSNYTMMDGASMVAGGGTTGVSVSGAMLGVEGIKEFRTITNSFPAEFGMTMGSQTTIVSKGGTNQFHGSLFEFLRNNIFDARAFQDLKRPGHPEDPRNPPNKRNNFGGSFGGPIRKDRQFFFITYEGFRERLGQTQTNNVPTLAARTDGGLGGVAAIKPEIKPYLSLTPACSGCFPLYPAPTEFLASDPTGAGGVAVQRYIFVRPTSENFGQARWDYNVSERDSVFVRYTIQDSARTDTPALPIDNVRTSAGRGTFVTLAENHTLSSALLNMFRFSYSRPFQTFDSFPPEQYNQFALLPGLRMGSVNPGSTIAATGGGQFLTLNQNLFTLADDMAWSHGAHSFKFGTLINKFRVFTFVNTQRLGSWTFNNLTAFLNDSPQTFSSIAPQVSICVPVGNCAGPTSPPVLDRTYRWETYGFYLQDDWKATSRLTLNLGLRYEFNTTLNETTGHGATFIDFVHDQQPTFTSVMYKNPSMKNFGPRFGFAYDVFGDSKTAIRGGFGLLYDLANITGAAQINATATPPFSYTYQLTCANTPTACTFPQPNTSVASTLRTFALRMIDYNLPQAHIMQYNLTLERQLPKGVVVSIAYAGSRGLNLTQSKEGNPTYPSGLIVNGQCTTPSTALDASVPYSNRCWLGNEPRQNPNSLWVNTEYKTGGSSSWYNSMQLSLQKRLSQGLQFQSSYTWSKTLDTGQGQHGGEAGGSPSIGQDPNNWKYDKGSADFDIRHSWTANMLYQVPAPELKGIVGGLLRGWRVGSIFTLKSGQPFTVNLSGNRSRDQVANTGADRPNVNPGRDASNITSGTSSGCSHLATVSGVPTTVVDIAAGTPLGTPDLYYDPCAFNLQPAGLLGNAGRNFLFGPGLRNLDFSLTKVTHLPRMGESGQLEFRFETFNLLNHRNLYIPSGRTVMTAIGTTAPLAGASFNGTTSLAPLAAAGQDNTDSYTGGRRLQFALKITF